MNRICNTNKNNEHKFKKKNIRLQREDLSFYDKNY